MIVDNHKNQLKEAYRVLEEGGTAGFTVWGRQDHCQFFTIMPTVLETMGIDIPIGKRSNFHLNDQIALEEDCKEAGFSSAKSFYTASNLNTGDYKGIWNFMRKGPNFPAMIKGHED